VLGVIGAVVFTISKVEDVLDDTVGSIGDGSGSGPSGGPRNGDGRGGSLVRRGRFAKAMRVLAREVGPEARVWVLRVSPDQVHAVVVRPGGQRRTVQIRPDMSTSSFQFGSGNQRGIPIRRIPVAAPERIVRRAARLNHQRGGAVGYLALTISPIDGEGTWSCFFTSGGTDPPVLSNLAGTRVYRAGELPPS
jgi:hypothetical protein